MIQTPSYRRTYLSQLKVEIKIWFFLVLLLALSRSFFIFSLYEQVDENSGLNQFIEIIFNGFRFDSKYAVISLLPLLLINSINSFWDIDNFQKRFRLIWSSILIFIIVFLTVVEVAYFQEYHDIFNYQLFGLVYDDRGAILSTLIEEYQLIGRMTLILIISISAVFILNKFILSKEVSSQIQSISPRHWSYRTIIAFVVVFILLGAGRGSFGSRPMQEKDAATTADNFLNKSVLVPHAALYYAIQWQWKIDSGAGLEHFLADKNIRLAAKEFFNSKQNYNSIEEYFVKKATGQADKKPKHIFLLIMESYSSWPLLEEYSKLGITNGLKELAREGILISSFLPASKGTMPSLQVIISGLPSGKLHVPQSPSSQQLYLTSLAGIFNRLDYQTRFFYGGYLSWQQLGSFAQRQGFKEVYGGGHMDDSVASNEWGVDDEDLFAFINEKLDHKPSLNVLLSTSNHPPFDLDLEKLGFPLKKLPDAIVQGSADSLDKEDYLRKMGHFWYADQKMLKFVRKIEKKFPDSLFLITGDHYGRRHFKSKPSLYEVNSVPLLIYGKNILQGIKIPEKIAGSHIDIISTLVELSAPEGYLYHTVGRNILDVESEQYGFGDGVVITPEYILENPKNIQSLDKHPKIDSAADINYIKKLLHKERQFQALGWWRVQKGSELPKTIDTITKTTDTIQN
ncbi:MAG: sulfatase-like hydrolase/transferase [Gammaproteobacteria bacterium]|nr:sulfatase-like hydrolase/transferase [Gammaproteobacteria bacterium]